MYRGVYMDGRRKPGENGIAKSVEEQQIYFPSVEEQRSIATVLSDMDDEIAALERRREKVRAIKQGMIQALLTGRVRLVNREASR